MGVEAVTVPCVMSRTPWTSACGQPAVYRITVECCCGAAIVHPACPECLATARLPGEVWACPICRHEDPSARARVVHAETLGVA